MKPLQRLQRGEWTRIVVAFVTNGVFPLLDPVPGKSPGLFPAPDRRFVEFLMEKQIVP
jgi:hypothetical protein